MKVVSLQAENFKRLKAIEISPDGNLVVLAGANAQGKSQPLSEPVLTPKGWTSMGELSVGDHVIGVDGLPVEVTHIFPQEQREVFEVTFADGGSTRCSPDHLWTVGSWVGHGLWSEETLTTAQIIESGLFHREHARRWAVPLVAPIEMPRLALPIEPYQLGVILGDGNIADTGYVQLSTDTEILDAIDAYDSYRRSSKGCEVLGSAQWAFRLEAMGLNGKLSQHKFVPVDYLRGSIDQRRALLAGLLDTDGTPMACAASEFGSTSEALADAVVDLARGLGMTASKSGPVTKKYTYKGEAMESRLGFWRVRIRSFENPFRLRRKAERWAPQTSRRPIRRFIDSIEPVTDEATQCIRVAAGDGLYVTKDYIVTHNSSILDAIWAAVGGTRAAPAQPIREGQDSARVSVDLGEIIVTRTWRGDKSDLVVTSANGAKIASPQKVLDTLVGKLAFDPLKFANASAKDQLAMLLEVVKVPLNLGVVAVQRQQAYDERTVAGREVTRLKGVLASIPDVPPTTPNDEVDIVSEMAELNQAEMGYGQMQRLAARKAEIEGELARIMAQATEISAGLPVPFSQLQGWIEAKRGAMLSVDATNADVRNRRAKIQGQSDVRTAERRVEELTHAITKLDTTKATAIRNTKMPVEGLSFTEDGVTYQGVPFSQASGAERIRVSVGVAMAANPNLRVIHIADGSLLDHASMQALYQMAVEHDYQVWVEIVREDGNVGIVIEDGSIATVNP